jgi:hypothetical protein
MHLVVLPISFVHSPICPFVLSIPFNVVIQKLAIIHWPIRPLKMPNTLFLSKYVVTLIHCSIWPCFLSFSMLFVFFPLAYILSSI